MHCCATWKPPSARPSAITGDRRGISFRSRISTACSCAAGSLKLSSVIPAILLMGPTASGKSALALELARHFDGEIISVDSAQIYRGMDIGTAKPDAATRALVTHHLIDIVDP